MIIEKIKLDKKSLLYLGAILIIALFIFAGLFFLLRKTETTEYSILKSFSAPEGTQLHISDETLKNFSASSGKASQGKVSEDIIKSLSAPK